MKFKIPVKLVVVLCLVVVVAGFVNGYTISTDCCFNYGKVNIESIKGANFITKSGNLDSKIWVSFNVSPNYSVNHQYVGISFKPLERKDNEPITKISIAICDEVGFGWNYVIGFTGKCNKSYRYNLSNYTREENFMHEGKIEKRNYTEYMITFVPEKTEKSQKFIFLINYTSPNFVFKQGDYYVAWLNLLCMEDIDIENSIILNSQEDIPRFLPDAKYERYFYMENEKVFYTWGFIFEGTGNKIVWYQNEKELEEKEIKMQEDFTNKGVWRGFWLSLIVAIPIAILILFVEQYLFHWSPYGDRILVRFKKKFGSKYVVGNANTKTYHKAECVFVDNIEKENRRQFENSDSAEKEGYKPCDKCNYDN